MNNEQLSEVYEIVCDKRQHTLQMLRRLKKLEALIGVTPDVTALIDRYRDEQGVASELVYDLLTRMAELND